jgi:molybdopterin synthase sulfur carrier subunit
VRVRVEVRLFAVARQRAGRDSLVVELPEGANVADLKRAIGATCPELAPILPSLLFAVENDYAADDRTIPTGAEVAAIPPVSGGQGC